MKQIAAMIALASLLLVPLPARCAESPVGPVSATPPAEPAGKDTGAVKPAPASPLVDPAGKDNSKMMKMMSGAGQGGEETQTPISGKVVEILAGGGYTYLCLEKDGQKTWVAVPERETKVGEELTVSPGTVMPNFESKTLHRTFEKIIFSGGVVEQKPLAQESADQTSPITGKILKTTNGGGYTYVLLKKENEEQVWLAVPTMRLIVGKEMTFAPGAVMVNFPSKALDRTFDKIVFSPGPVQGKDTKKDNNAVKKGEGSKGAPAAGEKISVEKAEGPGAYRVAELFNLKKKLNKKKVVVKGKVVSVSANIMKKNWIHLQDGSGDPKKKNNDLVVTSQDLPAEGDVITASGILHTDITMGSHKFPVVVEDAEIVMK